MKSGCLDKKKSKLKARRRMQNGETIIPSHATRYPLVLCILKLLAVVRLEKKVDLHRHEPKANAWSKRGICAKVP